MLPPRHGISTARTLDSWISDALSEEEAADQSQVITRSMKRPSEGSDPICPSSLVPARRPSAPSDFSELSGKLEGEDVAAVRRG